jgi:hypothetical protein
LLVLLAIIHLPWPFIMLPQPSFVHPPALLLMLLQ